MLTVDIGLAHVDDALHVHQGTHGSRGNPVLAGTCLGDDTVFAHAACKEDLPDGIIDFVCSGVVEVFPLEIEGAAVTFRQPAGKI